MSATLRLENVRVDFGYAGSVVHAVRDVSITVPPGRVVGLVGESGSGKSTLGRVAAGLQSPTAGRVSVSGASGGAGARGPVQMVFQDPTSSLDPRMTVRAVIAEALPRGLSREQRRAETLRLMETVHLSGSLLEALPRHLSGGMRQRVAVARALAARPEILIADEITAALDVSVQAAVLNLLREIQRELGMGMLFITHNLAIVRYLADEIAVMRNGTLVEHGSTEQVTTHPRDSYTAALIAAVPHAA